MRRPWLGGALLLLFCACPPDEETPKQTCTNELLATGNPWRCEGSLQLLKRSQTLYFSTPSRNHEAKAKVSLSLGKGRAQVTLNGAKGEAATALVEPGKPFSYEGVVALNRPGGNKDSFFSLTLDPPKLGTEGVAFTVEYRDVMGAR